MPEDGAAGASVRARPLHQGAPSTRVQSEGERDLQQGRKLRRTMLRDIVDTLARQCNLNLELRTRA